MPIPALQLWARVGGQAGKGAPARQHRANVDTGVEAQSSYDSERVRVPRRRRNSRCPSMYGGSHVEALGWSVSGVGLP